MNRTQKFLQHQPSQLFRSLVATAFIANGLFLFVGPALAQTAPTAANTTIDNQATATYEDPKDPNKPINTTSNKVTVTVAEVAGISISAGTPIDNNAGTVQSGDTLYFPFTVTNVGNDPTRFQLPNQAGITGPGTVSGNLQYSTDGSTWTDITGTGFTTNSIAINGTIQVRVPVTVNSSVTTGDVIKVVLGETTPPETATNSPRNDGASTNNARDVYTVDNLDNAGGGEVNGVPANGVVEGSTSASITVNTSSYSLATLLKTQGAYNNQGTPNDITGDTLVYNLTLRVESSNPTGQALSPAPLAGSTLTVNNIPGNYILVSDAIPAGTELAVAPTAPSGWQVVYYATNDVGTTDANVAAWTTTAPSLSTVTRIGFVKSTTDGTTSTYLALGSTVDFSIQVKVKAGQSVPLTIANIAQVFGKTPNTNTPVYDDSGDQNPSNYDGSPGSMTPPPGTDTNSDGVPDTLPPSSVDDGFINTPTNPETGTDTNGNNTGTGTGGEANVIVLNTASLLNGPKDTPNAVGPNDNNDDFTNQSSPIAAGKVPGSTINPDPVPFKNTILNNGTKEINISLLPTPPAVAGDLPNGTEVKISNNDNTQSITYVWNGTIFQYKDPSTSVLSSIDATTKYITIPKVAVNATYTYGVEVNLPDGTKLSTDIDKGFPVPITAFEDDATPGLSTEVLKNTTIDRVYTGFLKLVKFSAIEQGIGPVVKTGQDNFESTPAVNGVDPNPNVNDVARTPAPGNYIVYQIRYRNISEPASGTGNIILNADKVVITEDGNTTTNNWAKDNDVNTVIDTSHVVNSAVDSGTSTITFFSGNPPTTPATNATSGTTANSDVTKYVDTVTGLVAPSVEPRTFTFKRRVN